MGLLATSVMLTTACSDSFLEVENPSGEPLEEYYTTDAHIQEALYAAYDPTHWYDWGLGQYNALNIDAEVMGDNFWVGGANKGDIPHGTSSSISRQTKTRHSAHCGQWTTQASSAVMMC